MTVFPILKSESVVQVNDRFRLSAIDSFTAGPATKVITKVEIQPEDGADWFDVFNENSQEEWYLDWAYAAAGDKTARLKITIEDATEEFETTLSISCLTADQDRLFSNDNDLRMLEPDITKWIPAGYSSWNHVHRQAQRNILDWLDEIRIHRPDGTRWTAAGIVDKEQVRRLSKLIALRMIFSELSNQVGDVFKEKATEYTKQEAAARNRNYISVDFGGGTEGKPNVVNQDLRTFSMVRR